jgi:acyl-coenzyme A synthetase/AMP-(fatty) acid ligase
MRNLTPLSATTAAVAAGTWAASAYLDAKYAIRKDIDGLRRLRRGAKEYAQLVKDDKVCVWYSLEEQCKKSWDKRAIWSRDGIYTFGQMHNESLQYANWMLEQGVKPGDLVAMYMTNTPQFMFVWWACTAIGAAPAFINYNLEGKALMHCLEVCQTPLLIVDEDEGCRKRIEQSRADIEAKGMKIAVLDGKLKGEVASKPTTRPADQLRSGTKGSFPYCLIYTR